MSFVSATLGLPPISRHGSSPPPAEHRASALTGTPFQMGGCAGNALSEVYRAGRGSADSGASACSISCRHTSQLPVTLAGNKLARSCSRRLFAGRCRRERL